MVNTSFLIVLASGGMVVQADPVCTNASFAGTYYFTLAQVHVTPAGTDYCDEYGTALMDGAGHMTATSTRRCSLSGGPVTQPGRNVYKVNPDCSVAITDVNDDGTLGQVTHGKILMKGDMVLVDGTTRTDSSKLFHAVAVRISKGKPQLPIPLRKN
jgi:hypothetical protein